MIDVWRFQRGDELVEIQVRGNLSSADGTVLRGWALSGEGVSWEALWDVADDLASGSLVHLLPECRSADLDLYAVFAPGKPVPPRIRLFVDFLVRVFSELEQKLNVVTLSSDQASTSSARPSCAESATPSGSNPDTVTPRSRIPLAGG